MVKEQLEPIYTTVFLRVSENQQTDLETTNVALLASIAVSLKRIADRLESEKVWQTR